MDIINDPEGKRENDHILSKHSEIINGFRKCSK